MLQVFSDAGFFLGTAFATTLIFENWHTQVIFFSRKYEGLESCTIAEILGLEKSLQWIIENRPEDKRVEVYTDNLSVAQKLCDYVDTCIVRKGAYHALWMHMYELCDKFSDISVFHVPSHQPEHNPNKACDMLCAALLRPYKLEDRRTACTQ